MAITAANALNEILAAYKHSLLINKTTALTVTGGVPATTISVAGIPAAGSLNPSNTTNGVVPTDATAGFPLIDAFQGGNKGYLAGVEVTCNVSGSFAIYDVLFQAGQTTIPTTGTTVVTLTSRPSFVSRVPFKSDGTTRDYSQVELFIQMSVAGSNHAHSTTVTYLDQGGASGVTGNVSTQNIGVNRWLRCPLAAGDSGVSDITDYTVNGIASATGAVSVILARRLFMARTSQLSNAYGPDQTGLPEVFSDSALLAVPYMDSTSTGLFSVRMVIAEA